MFKKNSVTLLFLCISLIVLAAFVELEHSDTARVLTVFFLICLNVSYFVTDKKSKKYIAIF